jgi:hypothetical protein
MDELFTCLLYKGYHVADKQCAVAIFYSPSNDFSRYDCFACTCRKLQNNSLTAVTDFFSLWLLSDTPSGLSRQA